METDIGKKYTAARQALQDIHDIAIDYDGFRDVKSLMELIDELRKIARKGIDGKYVEEDLAGYGYLHKDDIAEGWVVREICPIRNKVVEICNLHKDLCSEYYKADCTKPIRPATVQEVLDGKAVKS